MHPYKRTHEVCSSREFSIEKHKNTTVFWPDHYKPENCPVHVSNQLDMAVSQASAWAWLIRAALWPTWYKNAKNISVIPNKDLKEGSIFKWKTFGISITSTVEEFIPSQRIAWSAKTAGLDVYHAWVLQPSTRGCLVLTEETQHGTLAILSNLLMPNRMHKYHQLWIEALEARASTGLPPEM